MELRFSVKRQATAVSINEHHALEDKKEFHKSEPECDQLKSVDIGELLI